MNAQDSDSLGWSDSNEVLDMTTASGEEKFSLYKGAVIIEGEEFTVDVLGGERLENTLLGVFWLRTKRLVVDYSSGILTLG